MNTKKLQSCLNRLLVTEFVKGLQITIIIQASVFIMGLGWPSESVLVLAMGQGAATGRLPDWDAMMK